MRISPERLAELCEIAVSQGQELLLWSEQLDEIIKPFALNCEDIGLEHSAVGFFGSVVIAGKHRSLMGCRQQMRIPIAPAADAPALRSFVFSSLLDDPVWIREGGRRGGFGVRGLVARQAGPRADLVEIDKAVDWRLLGDTLEWAAISIELYDFALRFGPSVLRPRQVVYVVQHPAFVRDELDAHGCPRVTVGYAFVPHAPLPNIFGYGPGKFGAAIKLYSVTLKQPDLIHVDMLFIAAPRCERVIDMGGGIPDPVYGSLRLSERLTSGRFRAQPIMDKLEAAMLRTHCNVHSAFIGGVMASRVARLEQSTCAGQ